jgi:hypothetical protein
MFDLNNSGIKIYAGTGRIPQNPLDLLGVVWERGVCGEFPVVDECPAVQEASGLSRDFAFSFAIALV